MNSFSVLWRPIDLFWNTRRSPSIFLCFNTAISNPTRSTEKDGFYGRKADSYSPVSCKFARSLHYYLAKSARLRHYQIASDHKWKERSTDISLLISIHTIHRAFKRALSKNIGPLWCSVRVVDGMPRAGSHYNLGTSRGPDKIGSRAGLGPRAASCTWLAYSICHQTLINS